MRSIWLDWRPTDHGSVGFEGSRLEPFPIIQSERREDGIPSVGTPAPIIERNPDTVPTKPAKLGFVSSTPDKFLSEQVESSQLAPFRSPRCAGHYDVGDGRKLHPPGRGEDFLRGALGKGKG